MFPINRPLKTWTEEDLQMLCAEKQQETTRLKYIKEIDPDPLGGRYELLTNITAIANSLGGVIIFGIEGFWDDLLGRCAGKLTPLKTATGEEEIVRIIESQISPKLLCYFHQIKAAKGGFYLVMHIPQSLERPHAFTWEKHLCWYIRKEQENRLLTEEEVRDLYFKAAAPRSALIERYNSLYLRNNVEAEVKIVAMPVAGDLELINTLFMTGEELMLGSKLFSQLSGISSVLQPKIDHFEAIFKNHNIVFIIKLLKNGEFLFSMGYDFLERIDYVPMPRLYVLWHHALKYFGRLYAYLGYYGPLRIFLETKNLNHQKIKIALKFGYFQKFLKDRVLVYKDTTVEDLADTDQLFGICTSFLKYIAQGCDMGIEEEYLRELERQVRERVSEDNLDHEEDEDQVNEETRLSDEQSGVEETAAGEDTAASLTSEAKAEGAAVEGGENPDKKNQKSKSLKKKEEPVVDPSVSGVAVEEEPVPDAGKTKSAGKEKTTASAKTEKSSKTSSARKKTTTKKAATEKTTTKRSTARKRTTDQ
ncbi:MAG TPA: ATP-binding protein [Bacillota bacterium]